MKTQRTSAAALLALLATVFASANDPAPEALIEGRHWKRLAAVAEQRLRSNPNDAHANYWMAYAKFEYRDYDGAEPLAEKAVKLDGNSADHHFILGAVYGRQAEQSANPFRKWSLAGKVKKEFDTAASLDPRHVLSRVALVDFHLEAPGIVGGDKKEAYRVADELLQIDPARGWLAKGRIARKEKQTSQLESLYLKAVEAGGRNYAARMALAGFYASDDQKKYDLAEKHAREAMVIAPDRADAYAQVAALYAHQQRYKELESILAQSLKNVPDNLNAYYQAGRTLVIDNRELPRAESYLRKYLTQPPEPDAPSLGAGHWRLGNVLEKMGRTDEACREYKEAVRLDAKLEDAKKDLKRFCK